MKNICIGLGNTGTQIIKEAISSKLLSSVDMYVIDSVMSGIDLASISHVNVIPIISDEKNGSGRNRERGKAMYKYHEESGAFDDMYAECEKAKAPVIVITSSAGGTGSGSVVCLCESLISRGIQVIPIIICPNMDDPDAYHLNTSDLMVELNEVGIETYSIFRNSKGIDYGMINLDVVRLIEIIFGKRYDSTDLDSIDDSDLDVILNMPGRFIALSAEASDIPTLKKELLRKVLSGFQPAWSEEDSKDNTFMTAYSLTSMFADSDFADVFEEVNSRIYNVYDEYRNISCHDNNGQSVATMIIAGLPRPELKTIESEFKEANSIGDGVNKSKRPKFMNKKKATVSSEASKSPDGNPIAKFSWK